MDSSFQSYENELQSLTQQLRQTLQQQYDYEVDEEQTTTPAASDLISQCEDLLTTMNIEARSVSHSTTKRELLGKVRVYKAQIGNLKDEYKQLKERASLLNGANHNNRSSSLENDHRERLLQANSQISSQNQRLENAKRVMAETEDVAFEITSELSRNREKIESAHGRVLDVSGMTNQARRLITSMSRREVQQKLTVYAVGAVLAIIVLFMIFWPRMRHGNE